MMNNYEQLHLAMGQMPALVGGKLCLDFVNTVEPRGGLDLEESVLATRRDYLADYTKLLAWSILAHIVTEKDAVNLLNEAQCHDQLAHEALTLRELLYSIFYKIAKNQEPTEQELGALQQAYLNELSKARLAKIEGHFTWQWSSESKDLASLTRPIVQSAIELLREGESKRLKVCPGVPGDPLACAWLFYDESKNRSRHWCSMQDCGSAVKARRLTERRRADRKRG
ncbi:hypothetical protein EPA93_46815 [Ktedonosporobacter rubrisoli]|uniref:Zinc finger CGNR domain-containing protein n=1 Tax=Ktedonosporobacter rubrisoli TaxID=2509675 RepID=A0A4V0Z0F9_KTERU|nr:ABATE domain-containing protein [Ktedonosporobacter rubrisoli]QBD83081.1 hypothetical protein EPA93_46815 [Ktedonosporobacter rubrisoli]